MVELRYRDSLDLMSQQQKIVFLEDRVSRLSKLERDQIPFNDIKEEIKINFTNLKSWSFSNEIRTNFTKTDTLKVFGVKWVDTLNEDKIKEDQLRLKRFLKQRLKLDSLVVRKEE